jgi:sulfite exporter TauE/SafE
MTTDMLALIISAVTISFLHTASGPDHYLPFIVLSRSRKWSVYKTMALTIVCGVGHILSSVIIGMIGVLLGWQLTKLDSLQGVRANISSWSLLLFGLVYLAWGIWKIYSNRRHKHFDVYDDNVYVYEHQHGKVVYPQHRVKVTPLILVAIFVMGPSEPLVPLLFYSGLNRSGLEIGLIITVFAISTVLTILVMVFLGLYGFSFFKTDKLERYMHAISGAVVTICGAGMVFLNW